MRKKTVYQVVLPLITAFIWGSSFVSQSLASGSIGTFAFNASRAAVAFVELLVLALLRQKRSGNTRSAEETKAYRHELLRASVICGTLLMLGSNLQQFGLESNTSSGKAGFITALYIVIVPLATWLLFRRRVGTFVWIAVALALGGLYLLCFEPGAATGFSNGDFYVLLCSFAFAIQILSVDYFTKRVDGVELSCAQFGVMTLLCLVCALIFDHSTTLGDIWVGMPYILYVGVLSSGVGYTLQILAQKEGDPTVVSLLLSFEAFFAALTGAIVLHERLSVRELIGCAVMLAAVMLAQVPDRRRTLEIEGNG